MARNGSSSKGGDWRKRAWKRLLLKFQSAPRHFREGAGPETSDDKGRSQRGNTAGLMKPGRTKIKAALRALAARLYKSLYVSACRAYARHVVKDRPADLVMRGLTGLHFWIRHGYLPHLRNPRSFEEKVRNRMLFDRNPRWTMLSDKLRAREYVSSLAGSDILVPLLWQGDDPEKIPFDDLPMKFALKTNHGCGYILIVTDKTRLDRSAARRQLRQWLGENHCRDYLLGAEWAYRNIRPTILVEAFIEDRGNAPVDYKFLCFSGRVELLQMNFDRFGHASEKFFDRDFNPVDLWNGTRQHEGEVRRPENFDAIIRLAERLAGDLDFIRVDLYNVGGRVYFGEFTCYPAGANIQFVPRSYDFLLGEKWKRAKGPGIAAWATS
jgi:hypothetical protein